MGGAEEGENEGIAADLQSDRLSLKKKADSLSQGAEEGDVCF